MQHLVVARRSLKFARRALSRRRRSSVVLLSLAISHASTRGAVCDYRARHSAPTTAKKEGTRKKENDLQYTLDHRRRSTLEPAYVVHVISGLLAYKVNFRLVPICMSLTPAYNTRPLIRSTILGRNVDLISGLQCNA